MMAIDKQIYNLHDIAERLGIKQHRSGRYHCFQSDRHQNGDKNPSLSIQDGYFCCFGCGAKGDVFSLIQQYTGSDFKGACEWLGHKHTPEFTRPVLPRKRKNSLAPNYFRFMEKVWAVVAEKPFSRETLSYFKTRAISPKIAYNLGCRDFHLGTFPPMNEAALAHLGLLQEDRLCPSLSTFGLKVPVFSRQHTFPVGWRTRKLAGYGPKELAPLGLGLPILPLGLQEPQAETLIICEGTPDYLSFETIKEKAFFCFDVWGLTSISAKWNHGLDSLLRRYKTVIYAGHDSLASVQLAMELGETFKSYNFPGKFFARILQEKEDANDLLKLGKLAAWTESVLAEVHNG